MHGVGLAEDQQVKQIEARTGNSITDSNVANMNRLFIQRQAQASAVEAWEFGRKLDVSYDGEETEIINRLIMMEERDLNNEEKKHSAKTVRERFPADASAVSIEQAGDIGKLWLLQ
ncbi:hypothetical protein Ancab_031821 [Ancistrocladus abbreviatus]